MQSYRAKKGFSLIELMVVLSVVSVLVGIAAPSFSNWMKDNRIEAVASQTRSMLNAVRSEGISRGEFARIEIGSGRLSTCVVTDIVNTCEDAIENAPIETIDWDAEKIDISSSKDINDGITFDLRGRLLPREDKILLTYCDERGANKALVITINQIGRAMVTELSTEPDAQCL
jgi:prepilin-type N-terminal cleavage/methylation domain-containing protein